MPVTRSSFRRDDGVMIPLLALVLVALMAMAAFAVDLGGVYNARRQDQSAADVAALAAAQELPLHAPSASEAVAFAESTLGVAAGTLDFNSCTGDPGALAQQISGANCISIDNSSEQVRVRIPDQEYSTFFANLVGVDEFTHSAFAIAALEPVGFAGILPFGIPALGDSGGYICPATPPSGLATDPCSGPTSGNFGYLNMAFYDTGECNTGGGTNRFGQNLAMGADHQIVAWAGTDRFEHTVCPTIGPDGPPNVMKTETGNIGGPVAEGMITGTYSDGGRGRLTRFSPNLLAGPSAPASAARTSVGAQEVDDNPLWNFIPAGLSSSSSDVPPACERDVFVDGSGAPRTDLSGVEPNFGTPSERSTFLAALQNALNGRSDAEIMIALMSRCFDHYAGEPFGAVYGITPAEPSPCPAGGCSGAVFSVNSSDSDDPDLWDIQYTPRFGYVPEFPSGCDPNGTSDCPIQRFRAIFIQQTCLGQGSGNCTAFDPGFGQTHASPNRITGVTMWAFPNTMLPGSLGDEDAPNLPGVNRFPTLVR